MAIRIEQYLPTTQSVFWMMNMTNEVLNTPASRAARRGRKCTDTPNEARVVARLEREYQAALDAPDLKVALRDYEKAKLVRDSIRRKLGHGSTVVTADDLARWEASLSNAQEVLSELARLAPILERHPVIDAVVSDTPF